MFTCGGWREPRKLRGWRREVIEGQHTQDRGSAGGGVRYLSLFSGIEAASVAWKPLGWECVAVAEKTGKGLS